MSKVELIQLIAQLCMGFAGDNPSMSTTASTVQESQTRCHAFYAACTKNNNRDFIECMIKRKTDMERPIK